MRREVALVALLTLATSCTNGLDEAADTLSSAPRPSSSSSPGASGGAGPTPAPDGRPAVIVTSPASDEQLETPMRVEGRAYVGDGEVSITLVDGTGTPLASTRTEVSCGASCRGRFSAKIAFFAQAPTSATLAVYEISAQDGSAINVVSIPVTLVPRS